MQHTNTTSVYTAAAVFPMLPEDLSTDRTSLNPAVDRLAIVVSMDVAADGAIPDREAGAVFAALGAAAAAGVAMPRAVAELRAAKLAADPTSWVRRLVVFQ